MSGWRRCERCRKVKTSEEYDGVATTCAACLTAPTPPARVARVKAAVVTRRASAPAPGPALRQPLMGSVGSGDLEVRERRAKRAALEALVEAHTDDYEQLLRAARAAEGLRPG